eukprot:PITA_27307
MTVGKIKGCGIPVKLPSGDIKHLKNVLYVPGIKKNLISVSMITDQDMQVQFFKNGCVIQDSLLETVATGVRVGNLYRLDARSMPRQAMVATTSTVENLWHQRFGHLNLQDLILLQKKDDCTRFSWVYFLSKKSQAFRYFKEFKSMIENQTGKKIKILRSDQGGEYRLDRKKLDPKALKCIFVGYGTEYKAYKLYNPVTHKVFASRDVIFHEPIEDGKEDSNSDSHIPFLIELNSEEEEEQEQEQEQKQEEVAADSVISDDAGPESAETDRIEVSPLPRRSGRKTRLLERLKGYALMSKILNIVEPSNYEEASKSDEWRAAMHEEMESIYRNHSWDLVELPEGKTPIGCKWLYKPKINANGSVEKYKARLVAKGYSQQEGIDFDDTFAL